MNAILKADHERVHGILQTYQERGTVLFDKVLAISLHARIPNLTHVYGFENIHKLIGALLTAFNESLNLVRPMTPEQIFECSRELVMTTEEDQLSIEDYVLFFKGAKEGKYGRVFDRMDQQTIFEMLEQYREQRHKEFLKIKETKHLEKKALGPADRTNEPNPLQESMNNLVGRLGEMKEKLQAQREINRMQKFNP